MEKKKKQWRVIVQPIATLVFRDPVAADTPLAAVDAALEEVNLCDLFQHLSKSVYGGALAESDFADGFDAFIVDPIGDDGRPDLGHSVLLQGDGVTPLSPSQLQGLHCLPEKTLQIALKIAQAVLGDEGTLDYVRTWTAGLRDVDADALHEAQKEIEAALARSEKRSGPC